MDPYASHVVALVETCLCSPCHGSRRTQLEYYSCSYKINLPGITIVIILGRMVSNQMKKERKEEVGPT